MKLLVCFAVVSLCSLLSLSLAGDCPCSPSPNHECYRHPAPSSRFESLSATNQSSPASRQSGHCTRCLFSVASAQQGLSQQCCQVSCPSPNFQCECNLFISNCNANFASFPKLKQKCYDGVYSMTYTDFKLLEDPASSPYDICNEVGACP